MAAVSASPYRWHSRRLNITVACASLVALGGPLVAHADVDTLDSGREALRQGDYVQAERALAVALSQHPDRLDVRRDYGLALLLLRRYADACAELQAVVKAAPEDLATARALALCRRVARRFPWLRLVGEAGVQYDSNVVLDQTAPAPGGGGLRAVATLALAARLPLRGPLSLEAGASYYQSVHLNQRAELGLFDVSAAEGTILASFSARQLAASLVGRFRETWTDLYRVHYGRDAGGEARVEVLRGSTALALWYGLRAVRFFDVNLPGRDDRDGLFMEPGIDLRLVPGPLIPVLGAHAAYLRNEADGDNFDYHGCRIGLVSRLRIRPWLETEALAGYTLRSFVHSEASRTDHEVELGLGVALELRSGVKLLLGFQHTTNASLLSEASYNRELVSVSLRGER